MSDDNVPLPKIPRYRYVTIFDVCCDVTNTYSTQEIRGLLSGLITTILAVIRGDQLTVAETSVSYILTVLKYRGIFDVNSDARADRERLAAFEMRAWMRTEKISWIDRVTNEEVLDKY